MNPSRLGRFEILGEIGQGAMGRVFLAYDPKIDRKVAIKTVTVPAGVSAEEALETGHRFLREAQAAGRLLHPNIVTIFDVGEEGGVPFIAMEYIEGETLAAHARPGRLLPLGRVLDLLAQAAAALDYAHRNNLVHRDIKPANLMVLKNGSLKITDFGLAKQPTSNLTQSGVLLGTPSYMSPEQIQGAELDGRSDLFSLGVVLYELLTGVRPFDAESISTTIYRVLYEDPRPPAAHNPALPPEINLITEKALAKAPDRRYATGADLVADLKKAFAALPAEALAAPVAGSAAPARTLSPGGGARGRGALATVKRDRGGRSAARPAARRAGPAPGGAAAVPTLFAHHPVKIAALLVTVVVGLGLFPRWVNVHEPARTAGPDRLAEAGTAPLSAAGIGGAQPPGGGLPGPGAAMPDVAMGRAGPGGQVAIDVTTIPHGATIFLDALPLAVPKVVLARGDPRPHEIEARAGCFHAVAEMTAADLASFGGPLVLELRPRKEPVPIRSDPTGARIRLNGTDTGRSTPAVLEIDGCQERRIEVDLADHRTWTGVYDSESDFDAMGRDLGAVLLEPIPTGTIVIQKPREYDVEVYAGNRLLGRAGRPLELPEGKHTLTLRNDQVFLREKAQVTVEGGRAVSRQVAFPSLGTLTVQAQPSNCKVYVNDVYLDVTPVFERPIVAGSHRVRVVFVPNGATREEAAHVKPGANARVMVRF